MAANETGAEHAASYLQGVAEGSEKCTMLRNLFSHCSYCSKSIGTSSPLFGLGKDKATRCSRCGWVYCFECITSNTSDDREGKSDDVVVCQNCKDRDKWQLRPEDIRNTITLIRSAIVVGSGVGGLACALSLKNRGVSSVIVLEKAPDLRTPGGAITVQTNGMRALLDVDPNVMAKVFDSAGALNDDGAFKTIEGETLLASKLSGPKESRWGNPEGRSVVRGHLEKFLYDTCVEAGVEVLFGVQVTDVQEDTAMGNVTVSTERSHEEKVIGEKEMSEGQEDVEPSREFTADFVIAADGIWSKVRRQLFPDVPEPTYAGYQMIVSVAPKEDFDQTSIDCWGEHWGKGNRFGFFRAGEGGMAMYYSRTCPADLDVDKNGEELKQIMVDSLKAHGYGSKLHELATASDASKVYRYVIRYMTPPKHHVSHRSGRVVLLGDAANGMPPNLGQGGCMALESASLLTQALLSSETLEEAMTKYEKRRLLRCALVAQKSKENGDIFQASNAVTVMFRNSLFRYLGTHANKEGPDVNVRDLPDPFAYLFSYRLMSWPFTKEPWLQ